MSIIYNHNYELGTIHQKAAKEVGKESSFNVLLLYSAVAFAKRLSFWFACFMIGSIKRKGGSLRSLARYNWPNDSVSSSRLNLRRVVAVPAAEAHPTPTSPGTGTKFGPGTPAAILAVTLFGSPPDAVTFETPLEQEKKQGLPEHLPLHNCPVLVRRAVLQPRKYPALQQGSESVSPTLMGQADSDDCEVTKP